MKAFEGAISGTRVIGRLAGKASREITKPPTTSKEKAIDKAEKAGAKEKGEKKKVEGEVENRLELLAKMYATDKAKRVEGEDVEEEAEGD